MWQPYQSKLTLKTRIQQALGQLLHHDAVKLVGGVFFKDADAPLVANLEERGLLFRRLDYLHSYPHCWRCHTALLYYAQPSWYIRTTRIKDELLEQNEATTWYIEDRKSVV